MCSILKFIFFFVITGVSPSFNIPENKYVTKATDVTQHVSTSVQETSEVKTSSVDTNNVVTDSSDDSAALTELGHNVPNLSLHIHLEDDCRKVEAGLHKETVSKEPLEAGHDKETAPGEAGHIDETVSDESSASQYKETVPREAKKVLLVMKESFDTKNRERDKVDKKKDSTDRDLADVKKTAGKSTLDCNKVSHVIHDKKKSAFIKAKEKSAQMINKAEAAKKSLNQKEAHQSNIQELESDLRMAERKKTKFNDQAKDDSQASGIK